MGSYSIVLFSLLLISSVIFVSTIGDSFADEVVATSIGFEDSTILELKNNRGNVVNISSVRIWLDVENEFKSFKTEQGWLGKKQLNGVIEFKSQNEVNPGESVKFGIKTTEQNPIISWKAIDVNGDVITSASTKTTILEINDEQSEFNKSDTIGIKDDSVFRFIPENPSASSDFRVTGEKFVPGQSIDFYIGNNFDQTIKADSDGKIFFTSKTPKTQNDERTEFVLRDSGGQEKIISIRLTESENRSLLEEIKLSIGNTPKDVKRGETINISGMATPNVTLTVTSKYPNGDIIHIETIRVENNGRWNLDTLFSPEIKLGQIGIDVSDGMTKIHRDFQVISPTLINVFSEKTVYQPGDIVHFSGKALTKQNMSIILEDSISTEIFSRSITVGDTGNVDFEITIPKDSVKGTYILHLFQGNEEGITVFGVGQEPAPVLVLRPTKLNYEANEDIQISIMGTPNAQVSLILLDASEREKFSDSINLGPDGAEVYKINSDVLTNGAYTLSGKRGESVGDAVFTVGFTTGSGAITIQTTKDQYRSSEQILIIGNTGSINVLLDVMVTDPDGKTIKKIETFSDGFGYFQIVNFRIPVDGQIGVWTVSAKSGGNFADVKFSVLGIENEFKIKLDKEVYNSNEIINIQGSGAIGAGTVSIIILNSNGDKIDEFTALVTNEGAFSPLWKVPNGTLPGEYEINVDDGKRNTSIKFTLI